MNRSDAKLTVQEVGRYGLDEELIKTNMRINGVRGEPILGKRVASMELTIGSKTLSTSFFVAEVRGSYNLILGCTFELAPVSCPMG